MDRRTFLTAAALTAGTPAVVFLTKALESLPEPTQEEGHSALIDTPIGEGHCGQLMGISGRLRIGQVGQGPSDDLVIEVKSWQLTYADHRVFFRERDKESGVWLPHGEASATLHIKRMTGDAKACRAFAAFMRLTHNPGSYDIWFEYDADSDAERTQYAGPGLPTRHPGVLKGRPRFVIHLPEAQVVQRGEPINDDVTGHYIGLRDVAIMSKIVYSHVIVDNPDSDGAGSLRGIERLDFT